MSLLRNKLGYIKRGIVGIAQNWVDRPKVEADILKVQIGTSVQGREIGCYTIGNGQKKVLMVCGIHGNEVGSVKLGHNLINWLYAEQFKYQDFTFYVIPSLNPDGYAEALKNPDYWQGGRVGRFNGNSVDLNRNFPTPSFQVKSVWGRGKDYSETTEVYCGPAPLSEPETKALVSFIQKENTNVYFAFHNAAAAVLGSNDELGQELSRAFTQGSGYKLETHQEWVGLQQTGTAKEWCDLQNIAYLEIEGRYRWGSNWKVHQAGIKAALEILKK